MKKALQAVGVLALFLWTALGAFAWSKVKDQVHVTVQDQPGGGEEVALLDDRLDSLSGDLDALVASLETNFGLLAAAMSDDAGAAGAERARAAERIRQLEAAQPATLEAGETLDALTVVLARLEAIEQRTASALHAALEAPVLDEAMAAFELAPAEPAVSPDGPGVELAAAVEAAPAGPAEQVPAATESPAAAGLPTPRAAEPEAAAVAPKKSFLSFRLPSRDFRFEGPQTFELLEDLSRVGFDAKSTLHDFSGASNRVRGQFRVDLAHPADGIEGIVEVAAESLGTDLEGRDAAMHEHLDTERFEFITFEPSGFEASEVNAEAQRVAGRLSGRMTIRGVARDVQMQAKATVDESRRLVVEGELPLLLTDYQVPVPNKLGVISMNDEVTVWIHLRARARAGGAQ